MGEDTPQNTAREIVWEYAYAHLDKSDENINFFIQDVYIVWFCYILKDWKALVSTTLLDGMYYEVTYNAAKKEVYLDVYKKFENKLIKE